MPRKFGAIYFMVPTRYTFMIIIIIPVHTYRAAGVYSDSKPGPCHFMDGSRRAAVALASFPGSGNTWVRGLLEKATGVCTGRCIEIDICNY